MSLGKDPSATGGTGSASVELVVVAVGRGVAVDAGPIME